MISWYAKAMAVPVAALFKAMAVPVAALLFVGSGWKVYVVGKQAGMSEVQGRWDAQIRASERQAKAQAAVEQKVIIKTVTKFVEKAAQERIVYRDIIREVEKYVPTNLPLLPGDFRVLHDAAASGVAPPKADDPARTDVAPVAPVTVAATVADNYAACRYDQGRLEALQMIVQICVEGTK